MFLAVMMVIWLYYKRKLKSTQNVISSPHLQYYHPQPNQHPFLSYFYSCLLTDPLASATPAPVCFQQSSQGDPAKMCHVMPRPFHLE